MFNTVSNFVLSSNACETSSLYLFCLMVFIVLPPLYKYCFRVVRVYNPEDRRIIKIKLTPQGNTLVKKINQHRRQMVINIFGKLSEPDRREYLRILIQIKDKLTKESPG